MSLLADLLAKIKQPQQAREVPPNLKTIVQSAASKSAAKKKIIILSVIIAVFVIGGIGAVYLINSISGTSDLRVSGQQLTAKRQLMPINEGTSGMAEQSNTEVPPVKQTSKPAAPAPVKKKVLISKKKPMPKSVSVSLKNSQAETGKKGPSSPIVKKTKKLDLAARDALLYKARQYEMKHDYSSAIHTYKEVLEMDGDNVMVLNSIAFTYLKLGLVQESIEYALKAEERNVNYVPALINLGIGYAQSEDVTAAEYYLTRAFKLAPDNKQSLFNLALLNERKGNFSEASGYFNKLMKLGDIEGTIGMARVYEKQGRNSESLQLYRMAANDTSVDRQTRVQLRQRISILQSIGESSKAESTDSAIQEAIPSAK